MILGNISKTKSGKPCYTGFSAFYQSINYLKKMDSTNMEVFPKVTILFQESLILFILCL